MKRNGKEMLCRAALFIMLFILWTALIQLADVRPVGQNGTMIGLASFNLWFHKLTGVHMLLYTITDWLGLVPIFICTCFGLVGLSQWMKRRSLFRVDSDIMILGGYYILVILGYLIFEMIPINYRPVLIDGYLEASYPSSTTLLVLSVMPTLEYQISRRCSKTFIRTITRIAVILFSCFMVIGRLVAGVHWFSDIVGSVLLSAGLFCLYIGMVQITEKK